MKVEFNWRDYDDYTKWLQDVLTTLYEENQELRDEKVKLLSENQQLRKEKNSLMIALNTSREKYNNDKVRYRRKYKNLKKQKDDVVEDIKKQITSCTNEAEGTVNNDKCWMAVNYLKKLLRMLGEIETVGEIDVED